jgi:hypothetical protein
LESLGFEWVIYDTVWGDRLGELAEYRKIHGHCNVPISYKENAKLARWVATQRRQYRLHIDEKKTHMTTSRIQELVSLGFEWGVCSTPWDYRLSELADYCKIHGHCNVPRKCSEHSKLANWVARQRCQHSLHLEGKKSQITPARIQGLEILGFEWNSSISWRKGKPKKPSLDEDAMFVCKMVVVASEDRGVCITPWEERLSELAEYRKIHGHCNVPKRYSENSKLGNWVQAQRTQYRLHLEGKKSQMTLSRIQALESLGLEWQSSISRRKAKPKKPSLDEDAMFVCKMAVEAPEHISVQPHSLQKISAVETSAAIKSTSLEDSDWNSKVHLAYNPSQIAEV